jgi:hypothetical protein
VSDFVQLAQTIGLPLASYLVAVVVLARVIVRISREKDVIAEARYDDMKKQFEARLQEQRSQYETQIKRIEDDRDWNRSRLHQALGLTDAGTATVEEVIRRLARELPPRGAAGGP